MQSMTLLDEGKMFFEDRGQGKPILFLHGWGTCARFFENQVRSLEAEFRVVVPDLRGHGASSALPEGDEIHTLACDVQQLLEHLDLKDVVICGWSMGSMVLWDLLLKIGSDRIERCVVIDMTPKLENDSDWVFGLLHKPRPYVTAGKREVDKSIWNAACESFLPKIYAKGTSSATEANGQLKAGFDWAIEQARKCDPDSMYRLWNNLLSMDFRDCMSKLKFPVLLLYGEQSQLYGSGTSAWLDEHLPQARRIAFAHSGHALHLEESEKFNKEVAAFANAGGGSHVRNNTPAGEPH